MDGAKLQDRVFRGYSKAAARAGLPYSLYRFADPTEPMNDDNLLGDIDCLFSASPTFTRPVGPKAPTRFLYADGRQLAVFDLLVGPVDTFFVGAMQPIVPIQAIRCNETISISRPGWGSADSKIEEIDEPVAVGLPCFRQARGDALKDSLGGVQNIAGAAIAMFVAYLPLGPGVVQQGDVVIDAAGRRHQIDTVDQTEVGTLITFRQMDIAGAAA